MMQPFARPIFDEHRAAGPAARAGHHHAVRPREAARRRAGLRRRGGHPLRRDATARYDGTLDGEFVWGAGQAAGHRRPGRASTASTWPRAGRTPTASTTCPMLAAVRPPRRRSTPTRGCSSWPCCGAGRWCTSTCRRRAQAPDRRPRAAAGRCWPLTRPGLVPYARFDISGRRAHPGRGSGDRGRQPPQLLRPDGHRPWRWPSGAGPCASSARRRCSTRRSSASWPGQWAASGSSGAPAPTSRSPRPPPALEAGEMVAIMPQGTIPRGPAFFDPGAEGPVGRGPPGRHDGRAGDPRRPVGHREGVAPQRAPPQPARPRAPAHRHRDGREAGDGARWASRRTRTPRRS